MQGRIDHSNGKFSYSYADWINDISGCGTRSECRWQHIALIAERVTPMQQETP